MTQIASFFSTGGNGKDPKTTQESPGTPRTPGQMIGNNIDIIIETVNRLSCSSEQTSTKRKRSVSTSVGMEESVRRRSSCRNPPELSTLKLPKRRTSVTEMQLRTKRKNVTDPSVKTPNPTRQTTMTESSPMKLFSTTPTKRKNVTELTNKPTSRRISESARRRSVSEIQNKQNKLVFPARRRSVSTHWAIHAAVVDILLLKRNNRIYSLKVLQGYTFRRYKATKVFLVFQQLREKFRWKMFQQNVCLFNIV